MAPRCHATAYSHASGRGSAFATPSRHGGSRYAPRESVEHHGSPLSAVVEEEIPGSIRLSDLELEVEQHDRVLREIRDDINHESDAGRACEAMV